MNLGVSQTFQDKDPGDCTSQRQQREACYRRLDTVGGGQHRVVVTAVSNHWGLAPNVWH